MAYPNDYTLNSTNKFKNLSLFEKNNDPKTHAFIIVAGKCLLPVDDTLVQKLGIKDGDTVYQEVDDKGSIRLVFEDTKNRSSQPQLSQEADDQDYGV